ncbi:MAG TPA: transporter substrate-binding domain-containing protein [Candidatus Binatia bacterium]|nr:transporter substrate-binding domain-containing protein [Candidatus Binatia bacterium]
MTRLAPALLLFALSCLPPRPAGPPLRVGTSSDYPPFSFVGKDGTPQGFDVEVARRFARDSGRRLELVTFRWPALRQDLAADRFDVAMSGVTMRAERAVGATFTRPVLETGAVVLVRPETARNAAQLDRLGLRLAVNAGGHLEWVARRLFPHALIQTVADNLAVPRQLEIGAADAVLVDAAEAPLVQARAPWATALGPLTRDRKAYLARDPALADALDAWLRAHEADGSLAALRARWFGKAYGAPRSAFASDLDALLALVDLRLAFMPAVATAKAALGRPVEDPAQEDRVRAAVGVVAAREGLAPDAADALFAAQIAAARAVERAVLALPPGERPPVPPLDLAREARPALAAVSETIVARAAAVAADPAALAAESPARLAQRLDPVLTPAPARRAIAEAIVGLRRAPDL